MTKRTFRDANGKNCTVCDTDKAYEEFYRNAGTSDGRQSSCKICHALYTIAYQRRARMPDHQIGRSPNSPGVNKHSSPRNRMSRHQISRKQYDEAGEIHACEICGTSFGAAHTDHDHVTGQWRGMLCSKCNTGLGKLGDSLEGLERASYYLVKRLDVLSLLSS